jgi:superfamily I DNA and/or RNA helicase
MMPSALFYADKLHCVDRQATDTNWCAIIRHIENMSDPVIIAPTSTSVDVPEEIQCRKQFDWPIHFRGVVGNDVTITIDADFASNSWQNMAEAETIVDICVTLSQQGVTSNKIGVMSPYRGQVVLIRKLLRSKHLGGINVGTVEDYQSVEFDVILLSLVRSTLSFVEHDIQHRMGVFGQPKRSNVALTRAEFLFVVVRALFCDHFFLFLDSEALNPLIYLYFLQGWQSKCDGKGCYLAAIFIILPSEWFVLWGTTRWHDRTLLVKQ